MPALLAGQASLAQTIDGSAMDLFLGINVIQQKCPCQAYKKIDFSQNERSRFFYLAILPFS